MNLRQTFKDLIRRGRIIKEEDPRLRTPCEEVTVFDEKLAKQVDKLYDEIDRINKSTDDPGEMAAGLAAPQLGMMVRVFVINTESFKLALANPEISAIGKATSSYETCLSLPGRHFMVARPQTLTVKGQNVYSGMYATRRLHGRDAQMVAHEINHLNGIMLDQSAVEEVFP